VDRRIQKLIFPALVIGALLLFASPYLNRDLWFDEALTYLHFARMSSPLEIYSSYFIPNNQILYSVALHYWSMLLPGGVDMVVWFRLLSSLFAAATLLVLYRRFRVRLAGGAILLPVLVALAVSVPFLIYATALRGYMLSALLVTLALDSALDFAARPLWKRAALYALWSLGAVATIPSNLLALGGVVLFALPLFGPRFYRRRAFWVLAAIPLVAFAAFYGPIYDKLLGCMALREGWPDGGRALLAVYAAFLYSFAMLLLPGTGAVLAFDRAGFRWERAARAAIWLLPLPTLLLPVAPFPRVFFPFWPLWALLVAGGIRDLTALNCRWSRRWNCRVWIGALVVAALGWSFLAQQPALRLMFSRRFGGAGADDYFYGYYLRNEHKPGETASQIAELADGRPQSFYASFAADPWPLMFYLFSSGVDVKEFRFDGPRGPVAALEPGMLVILRADESAATVEKRFRRHLVPVYSNGNHGVYRVR